MILKDHLIVHVAGHYPPHTGGLERVVKMAAEGLADNGYKVRVLTSDIGIEPNKLEQRNNLDIKALWSFEVAHIPFSPMLSWHLLTLPKKSIIHLHLSQAYYPERVFFYSKLRGIPYVVHFHLDVEPSGFFGPLFVLYKKLVWGPLLRNAQKVIICSNDQERLVQDKFGVLKKKIVVIANAVGSDFFSDHVYAPSTEKLRLLYIGRLAQQKRVERVIEMMSHISIPAHLTIIGDGEDQAKLEAMVRNLNLTNVSFEGKKNDVEMQRYHRENDIFVMSSDKEGGTPLVALEAMAAGLPVIGTDVTGIREFLKGVGVIIREPYAVNFAKTVSELFSEPEKMVGLSKSSLVKAKQYTWSRFINQLESVYNEIIV